MGQRRVVFTKLAAFMVACALASCTKMQEVSAPAREPAPVPAAPVPMPRPVYNAYFESADNRTPVEFVRPKLKHELHFWIGPRDKLSVISDAPTKEITDSLAGKRLRVIMACDFCASTGTTQAEMFFDQIAQTSNRVSFDFIPDATAPEQSARAMQVAVYDRDTGRMYDRVKVPVTVSEKNTPPPKLATTSNMNAVEATKSSGPDILISVTEEDRKGVAIALDPVSDRAKNAIGSPLLFHSGPLQSYLAGLAGAQYTRVSALTLQGDLARELNHGTAVPVLSATLHESSVLNDMESAAVSNYIGGIGTTLYNALFCKREAEPLCQAVRKMETIGTKDKPLRVSIPTDTLSLPWQYLHPSGDGAVDVERFWGMKYILSARRSVDGSPPPIGARAVNTNKIVFARYALTTDDSYNFATQQIDQIRKLPVQDADLLVVRSRKELINAVGNSTRNQISALIAYLHAHSSAALVNTPTGPAYAMSAPGPELMFADADTLPSSELAVLNGSTKDDRYFGKGPLVILNACETNPSGIAFPQANFTDTLFQLGAQGVIATEVSVWIPFGHLMATTVLKHLAASVGADEALTRARIEIYKSTKNPFGLLYAYYGEPGVQLLH